ncbi:fucolectin-like, partial [Littorina saxatilis]
MRLFLILICWVLTQQKDNETDQPPRDTGEDLRGMSKQANVKTTRDGQNGSSSTAVKDTVRGQLGKTTWAPHSGRVLKMLSDAENNPRRFRRQQLIPKGLTNVALYKPAWASSYYDIYNNPNSANDGNLETSLANCFNTAESDNNDWHWWRVDLLAIYDIFYVSVTNRGDCCQDRLRNFTVRVAYSMKQKYTPIQSDTVEKTCVRVGTLGLGAT